MLRGSYEEAALALNVGFMQLAVVGRCSALPMIDANVNGRVVEVSCWQR